jgi:phosphatidylglycerophosphate synthase
MAAVPLRCALVADAGLPAEQWRARLALRVAGLPLLARRLRCLRAAGFDTVTLVGPAWREIGVPATRGLRVDSGPDDAGLLPASSRWVLLDASLVIDGRMLGDLRSRAAGLPGPVRVVDDFDENPAIEAKSPFLAGPPATEELRPAGEASGRLVPIGLAVTGAAGATPLRLHAGRYTWHRVRDAGEAREAGWRVMLATVKRGDGWHSRWNRRISLRLSRLLVGTALTPNLATALNAVLSLAAGWLLARGSWGFGVAGSALFWFTCIFDGVDGEIARARFEATSLGDHLDAVETAVFYLALVGGLGVGLHAARPQWYLPGLTLTAAASLAVWWATTMIVSRHAVRRQAAPHDLYHTKMHRDAARPVRAVLGKLSFLCKRAAVGWYLLAFALADGLHYVFAPVVLASLLSAPVGIYVAVLVVDDLRRRPPGQKAQLTRAS